MCGLRRELQVREGGNGGEGAGCQWRASSTGLSNCRREPLAVARTPTTKRRHVKALSSHMQRSSIGFAFLSHSS